MFRHNNVPGRVVLNSLPIPPIASSCARFFGKRRRFVTLARLISVFIVTQGCQHLADAADVAVRQISATSFELLLSNATPLNESDARKIIASAAATVCKAGTPLLGRYSFDEKEIVGRSGPTTKTGSFRFRQEVSCQYGPAPAANVPFRPLEGVGDTKKLSDDIRRRSEAHFKLLAAGRFEEALLQMSVQAISIGNSGWIAERQSFRELAGEPTAISIVKVTIYDNPAQAPTPGLYVAADFSNTYTNVPINCGYLMWFRPSGGEFKIIRQESGYVTAEQLRAISSAQLPEVKRRLRCIATPGSK